MPDPRTIAIDQFRIQEGLQPNNLTWVVVQGRTPGLYQTWAECHAQLVDFERGLYFYCTTREEAEAWWQDNIHLLPRLREAAVAMAEAGMEYQHDCGKGFGVLL